MRKKTGWFLVSLSLLGLVAATFSAGSCRQEFPGYAVVQLEAGPDLEFDAREALITAQPGTIIEFPAGRFPFRAELTLTVSHVVIRGQGMNETVLDFTNQEFGAQGLLVTANAFVMQDIGIENPRGDGVKVEGANGVTFENVRVEWTGGPSPENGSYGLYPVQSRNVLVEGCVVKGASDAGIYVGQSNNIIVRRSTVEFNVAGIEIENSRNADVYLNEATHNTGGILIFDLPGLPVQGGMNTRVYDNYIHANNTFNFAPPGNIVGLVPAGTGLLIMANDDVEVFGNIIKDHITTNVAVVSYLITQSSFNDPIYDPYPEAIYVHDNQILNAGTDPQGDLGFIARIFFQPFPVPDIVVDDWVNEELTDPDGNLPPELRVCFQNNGPATFGSLNQLVFVQPPITDPSPHDCAHAPLSPNQLEPPLPVPPPGQVYSEEEIAALCGAPGSDVNWDALVVNCPRVSDYRLFLNNEVTSSPNDGGVPFDLTTPLFSDYALKYRFLFLPPGASAGYSDTEVLDLPVGTVIVKSFSFPFEFNRPELGERVVETRLLIHGENGWRGVPYIWNQDMSEAFLSVGGGGERVSWIHFDETERSTTYQIPSVNHCGGCHGVRSGEGGTVPIGPKARLLNKDFDYPGVGVRNQLDHWTDLGILAGAPPSGSAPRLPVWDDPLDGSLEDRSRAYLESNCAHCHSPLGPARSTNLLLEADRPLATSYGLCKPPVAAGRGAGDLDFDIVPGSPEESILIFRMNSTEAAIKMPELSRSLVHEEGVALVSDWIASLPGSCQ